MASGILLSIEEQCHAGDPHIAAAVTVAAARSPGIAKGRNARGDDPAHPPIRSDRYAGFVVARQLATCLHS